MNWQIVEKNLPTLLNGMGLTLFISLLALVIATVFGFLIALMRTSNQPLLRRIAATYNWIVRGLPVMILLFLLYYSAPFGLKLSAFSAGLLGLTINGSAFIAEIFRSGFRAVDQGQIEAGKALGYRSGQIMWFIKLPAIIKIISPTYVSNAIALLKESAQVSVITVPDLMLKASNLYATTYRTWETLGVAAVLYLILCSLFMIAQWLLEKKYNTMGITVG
ncbi:amino acid ABC transporter permease [Loigolactobacillus bifermentans]|nr:amino acid ABC transporter permease [Loigolactobacillus bifermentans]QGG60733.1 ABC transporter permease subunit [Loigolactobacillus bifermentans]